MKDPFFDFFNESESLFGKLVFKDQSITANGVYISEYDHLFEEFESKTEGEELEPLYHISKRKDGSVKFIKIPESTKRELKMVLDQKNKLHIKTITRRATNSKVEENESKFFILLPEMSVRVSKLYNFIFGDFFRSTAQIFSLEELDEAFYEKNVSKKFYFKFQQGFSNFFQRFTDEVISAKKNKPENLIVVSTVNVQLILDVLKKGIAVLKDKDLYRKYNDVISLVEASSWFSIIDIFNGWYYKAKTPIKLSLSKDVYSYIKQLSLRGGFEDKGRKKINLNFINSVSKKMCFNTEKETLYDSDYSLFEKLDIVRNCLIMILSKEGGIAE